jgi:hypothetical protein
MRDVICRDIARAVPIRIVYWCLVRVAEYFEHEEHRHPVGADNISLQKAIIITRAHVEGVGRQARKALT